MSPVVAKVVVDVALDREFDYFVPEALGGRVRIGSVVGVPFGRRHARGFVTGMAGHSDFPDLKAIASVADGPPLFGLPEMGTHGEGISD